MFADARPELIFHLAAEVGGIGANRSYPGRVFKGKRMAGRLGNARVTIENLQVVDVRADQDLLFIRGAIPGAYGTTVIVRKRQVSRRRAAGAGAANG